MKLHLFTPRHAETDQRLSMQLTDADYAHVQRGQWSATVTDQETGLRWNARGASCGASCFCDAIVEPAGPATAHPLERLRREFPDYNVDTLPAIPAHWSDDSWHNDACPFFTVSPHCGLFVDFAARRERDCPDGFRFIAVRLEDGQHVDERQLIYCGDDWDAALAALLAHQFAAELRASLTESEFTAMQQRNVGIAAGICASHDFCDANMPMATAFQTVTGRDVFTGDAIADADAALWNAAWAIATPQHLTAKESE